MRSLQSRARPSVIYFSAVKPGLFGHIIRKYMPMGVNPGVVSKDSGTTLVKTGF